MKRQQNLDKFLIVSYIISVSLVNLQNKEGITVVVSPSLELVLILCKNLHKIKLVLNTFYYIKSVFLE